MTINKERQYITYEHRPETLDINLGLSTYLFQQIRSNVLKADVIVLYLFYYHHAKIQEKKFKKSSMKGAYITNKYVMEGLHWSKPRMQNAKNKLMEIGLAQQKVKRDENNKIKGWYIHVYLSPNQSQKNSSPPSGESQRVASQKNSFLPGGSKNTSTKGLRDNINTKRLKDSFKFLEKNENFGINGNNSDTSTKCTEGSTKSNKHGLIHLFPKVLRKSKKFKKAWSEWEVHNKSKRSPLTELRVSKQIKIMDSTNTEDWITSIDFAISGGWTALKPQTRYTANSQSNKEVDPEVDPEAMSEVDEDNVDADGYMWGSGDEEHDERMRVHNLARAKGEI